MSRTVESEWLSFYQALELDNAPPIQVSEMRRAFYGGAQAMLTILTDNADLPEDRAVERLCILSQELQEFARDVGEGRA